MPDSAVLTFTDLDAYQRPLRSAQVAFVSARGKFGAELTRVDLHRPSVYRGDETSPRVVANSAIDPKLYGIILVTNPTQPPIHISGLELSQADTIVHRVGSVGQNRSAATCRWGFTSLPREDLAAAGGALIRCELTAPYFTHRIRPPAPILSLLSNLHEAVGHLAICAAPHGPEWPPGDFPETIPEGWDEQVHNARDAPAHHRSGRADEIGC